MDDMKTNEASVSKLDYEIIVGIVREHEEIKREISALRAQVGEAGSDASRANYRINTLEHRMDELAGIISEMRVDMTSIRVSVKEFGPKQDAFLTQTWGLISKLLIVFGSVIAILGAIVGVKVSLPFFN